MLSLLVQSTVMALLERFYDPVAAVVDRGDKGEDERIEIVIDGKLSDSNGVVMVDGVDIRKMDVKYLRNAIALVGQEPVLFDASVRENIAFGKDGASEEEIMSAAKTANAHEFISNFDGGYDYNVGSRGKKVSGGQKQRIAIARAVLKEHRILLLDEATSALDNESEKLVQASLDNLIAENKAHDRTTIIIAHRLSTVRNADCIYVFENAGDGAVVVESGTHKELIALNGKYKALLDATMQSSED
jgi:ATP-binding cassette subfamily B (MDR/TAP) protein 1